MIFTTLLVILTASGLGAGVFIIYHLNIKRISLFYWFALLAVLILAPICVYTGWQLGKANKMSFSEFWNGWEIEAVKEKIECERDGNCSHYYDCDPYIVTVCNSCNCDSKGNCSQCCHPETRYHDCPYVDAEYNYKVITTVGNFDIDKHRFPDNPQKHRWRKSTSIPETEIQRAGTDDPSFWTEVKNRLLNHKPGPATVIKTYDNYLYASDRTILKQYSSNIKFYKDKGLMPSIEQNSIYNFYRSNKVYLVGISVPNYEEWKDKLEYFNANLGTKLQGDLYIVITDYNKIDDIYVYSLALKTYWQDTTQFRKRALSKNAIVVIIGTDGTRIVWGASFTGMPMGNDLMMNKIKEVLVGKDFTISIVLDALEDVVFGKSDSSTKFKRISMKAKDKGDTGSGYNYLEDEIDPTDDFQMWIIIISIIICCIPWVASLSFDYCKNKLEREGY